jgi:hypothetical protein
MSYDLRCFGWDNCIVPHTLKAVETLVPRWNQLKIVRKKKDKENLQFINKFFENGMFGAYMPGYIKGALNGEGSYAHIYLGKRGIFKSQDGKTEGIIHLQRDVHMEDVCIKEIKLRITDEEENGPSRIRLAAYKEEMRAILNEAFLHALVLKVFENLGIPQRVPKLYEVVGITHRGHNANSIEDFEAVWMVMEMLRGHTIEKYLRLNLVTHAFEANESILIDILIQLAHFLHILQTKLRFNHRDIKLNNLFVRYHAEDELWLRDFNIEGYGNYICKNDITILDYGFSCIGCAVDNTSLISAGSWFDEKDLCFKQGRDLCQFLYSLHAGFPLQNYISPSLFELISTAMITMVGAVEGVAPREINLLNGIKTDGTPQVHGGPIYLDEGLYTFLKRPDVSLPGCTPLTFLSALRNYNRV